MKSSRGKKEEEEEEERSRRKKKTTRHLSRSFRANCWILYFVGMLVFGDTKCYDFTCLMGGRTIKMLATEGGRQKGRGGER